MEPVSFVYRADPIAIDRVRDLVVPPMKQRFVVFCAAATFQALAGLSRLVERGAADVFAIVLLVLGVAYPAVMLWAIWLLRPDVPTVGGEITIDESGLTIRPSGKSLPWRRVRDVRDVGEAFVFSRRSSGSIVLFKRDVPDGGRALWAALDDRLVAKSYLARGSSSRTTITNTAVP